MHMSNGSKSKPLPLNGYRAQILKILESNPRVWSLESLANLCGKLSASRIQAALRELEGMGYPLKRVQIPIGPTHINGVQLVAR